MKKAISIVTVLMLLLAMAVPASGLARASYANYNNVHEFGHLLGAPDHYKEGDNSTDAMNRKPENQGAFNSYCIYGEDAFSDITSATVARNLPICDGCKAKITATLSSASNSSSSASSSPAACGGDVSYKDVYEYRKKVYFDKKLPSNFIKWDNVSWLGEFGGFAHGVEYGFYGYSAKDSNISVAVDYEWSYGSIGYTPIYYNAPTVEMPKEMTSMLNAPPQEDNFKITRLHFEYHYAASGKLVEIVWQHGNATVCISGDFSEYEGKRFTVIGNLLSASPVAFAAAWIAIMWNLCFTPMQTALLLAGAAGVIILIVVRKKKKAAGIAPPTEEPAE